MQLQGLVNLQKKRQNTYDDLLQYQPSNTRISSVEIQICDVNLAIPLACKAELRACRSDAEPKFELS
jgi:hypothetical protein